MKHFFFGVFFVFSRFFQVGYRGWWIDQWETSHSETTVIIYFPPANLTATAQVNSWSIIINNFIFTFHSSFQSTLWDSVISLDPPDFSRPHHFPGHSWVVYTSYLQLKGPFSYNRALTSFKILPVWACHGGEAGSSREKFRGFFTPDSA